MKRKIIAALIIALFAVAIATGVEVYAGSGETVRVSSEKQLRAAMKNDDVGTIIFRTQKYMTLTIKKSQAASEKFLIIDAPNADITNKAVFAGIDIMNAKSYTESVSGNRIALSDAWIKDDFIVSKKKHVENLKIYSYYFSQPFYILRKGASIKSVSLIYIGDTAPVESTYDSEKRLLSMEHMDPYGYMETNEITLDKYGRMKRIRITGEGLEELACDDIYTYDSNGNILSVIGNSDFSDVKNTYSGNTLQKKEAWNGANDYTYDEKGQLIRSEFHGEQDIDNNTYTITRIEDYKYDEKGRLIFERHEDVESEYIREMTYTYNSKGFLSEYKEITTSQERDYLAPDFKQYTSVREYVCTYKYNKAGDMTVKKEVRGDKTDIIRYKYDSLGELIG